MDNDKEHINLEEQEFLEMIQNVFEIYSKQG